jgi:hypothetical protein
VLSRRIFLQGLAALPIALLAKQERALAQIGPEFYWSGVGFSVAEAEKTKYFSQILNGLELRGGMSQLESAFSSQLANVFGEENVHRDPFEMLDLDEIQGSLLFSVVFDYEQFLEIPDLGAKGGQDLVNSMIFATATIFVVSDDELRIKYSIPFYTKAQPVKMPLPEIASTMLFDGFDEGQSIVEYMGSKISEKKFEESACYTPLLRVVNSTIRDKASTILREVGIDGWVTDEFVGSVLSSSLAMKGGLSVLPHKANSSIGFKGLIGRFKNREASDLLRGLDELQPDITFDIEVRKIVRKLSGSTATNRTYTRFVVLKIVATESIDGKAVFDGKIGFGANHEVPISMMKDGKLPALDSNLYFQIIISLIDTFVEGVMKLDWEKLESINLKKAENESQVGALADLLTKARDMCS